MVRNPKVRPRRCSRAIIKSRSVSDISEALKAQKMFSSREWKRLYSDGTVAKWLQQVSDFFMTEAGWQMSHAGNRTI